MTVRHLLSVWLPVATLAAESAPPLTRFQCAGPPVVDAAPKVATAQQIYTPPPVTGGAKAITLFARFRDDPASWSEVPAWAAGLFDVQEPGSLSHFFHEMSGGRHRLEGDVAPRIYTAAQPAAAYLSAAADEDGGFGRFVREILAQADVDVDFSRFDSDGADGIPGTIDDDGVVDAVFVVLDRVATNFLRGPATGIASLGFSEVYVTADRDAAGRFVRILPAQGTVQQGATFAAAAGTIAHEYGHLLGLPDLFDVAYVRSGGPHEQDSAGLGRWGLMAWGASGWRDDGPGALSAYSRFALGWARLEVVRQRRATVTFEPVGRDGSVYLLPLPNREFFLVENRQRQHSYYDRGIPGEGLLVYHVDPNRAVVRVDLECADGRWSDAGFPLGAFPDPHGGGDNLDFWAHDLAYAREFGGNQGDGTDPFDGVRFRAFTPDTNPAALSLTRQWPVWIEDITFTAPGRATARVTLPPMARFRDLWIRDQSGDAVLVAGEPAQLHFVVKGDRRSLRPGLRVRLVSADELLRGGSVVLSRYRVEDNSLRFRTDRWTPLRFHVAPGFSGWRRIEAELLVEGAGEEGWILLWREPYQFEVFSPKMDHIRWSVVDTAGNGDGTVQPGELFRLNLRLSRGMKDSRVTIRSLDPRRARVVTHGPWRMEDGSGGILQEPEFLAVAGARADSLRLAVHFDNDYEAWSDTIAVAVVPGTDPSAPRVGKALSRRTPAGVVQVFLPADRVVEAGPVQRVSATLWRGQEEVTTLPLAGAADGWSGALPDLDGGELQVRVDVVDAAGNVGRSPLRAAREAVPVAPSGARRTEIDVAARIAAAAVAPDGSRQIALASGAQIVLFDPLILAVTQRLDQGALLRDVAISNDATLVAGADATGTVKVWRLAAGGRPRLAGRATVAGSRAVALSADGLLAVGDEEGVVHLWTLRGDRLDGRGALASGRRVAVTSLAVAAGDARLAVGYEDGQVDIWYDTPGPLAASLTGHQGAVEAVAFSHDGTRLATGSRDGTARVWDLARVETPVVLSGHQDWVSAVAFRPRTSLLVTASWDGLVRVWDVNGRQREILDGGRESVNAAAFTGDGLQLVTASWSGTLQLWTVGSVTPVTAPDRAVAPAMPLPAYPNPFTDGVFLPFTLDQDAEVTVRLHDVTGQLVRQITLGRRLAGRHAGAGKAAFWDGRDEAGEEVGAGVYFLSIEALGQVSSRKVVRLR